jgi:hypothetical protein
MTIASKTTPGTVKASCPYADNRKTINIITKEQAKPLDKTNSIKRVQEVKEMIEKRKNKIIKIATQKISDSPPSNHTHNYNGIERRVWSNQLRA